MRISFYPCLAISLLGIALHAQNAGRQTFDGRCALCHGTDGGGGEFGPAIIQRIPRLTDEALANSIRDGIPARGMPATNLSGAESKQLIGYLRTLRIRRVPPPRRTVTMTDGKKLDGLVLNQSSFDLQLRTDDKKVHLLRATANGYREVTSQVDWTTYHGGYNGNRFTELSQITRENVARLAAQWTFTMEGAPRAETTPVVVKGMMYITSGNECWALDAGTGREIWHFQRPRTKGLVGNAEQGFNRGVAWAEDRVFMVTDNAHIIALDRFTGELLWDTEMADWRQNYNATSAPLAIGNMVVSGTAGGEQGARGFVAAFDQATGKEIWRTWTVPKRGEPGSETWEGNAIDHPSAVTWFTGSYDPALDTIYWATGNPGPNYNDHERGGDNLYSDSMLALDAKTGKMKWYYQFTPHDNYDWDAAEPALLIDTTWQGAPRKLLVQANRNGFFYVLDRVNGVLLQATKLVDKVNWASGIGRDGRPILNKIEKAEGGSKVCPSQDGATNWYSTAYDPGTSTFFVQTLEKCSIYYERPTDWQAGKNYLGGSQRAVPGEVPQKVLRALDLHTGKEKWTIPQTGPGNSWGGVLAAKTGVLFYVDDGGMFRAVDSSNGRLLWQFLHPSQTPKASPMTYMFDGKQYVAIAIGNTVYTFGLNDLPAVTESTR
jgi:alcohol dehydrogenase (cytochrome c)